MALSLSIQYINHGTTSHTLTLQELVACVHGQWQQQTQTQMKGGWANVSLVPLWSVGAVTVNHLVNEEVKRGIPRQCMQPTGGGGWYMIWYTLIGRETWSRGGRGGWHPISNTTREWERVMAAHLHRTRRALNARRKQYVEVVAAAHTYQTWATSGGGCIPQLNERSKWQLAQHYRMQDANDM